LENRVDKKIHIVGSIPTASPAEHAQFERVISALKKVVSTHEPWAVVALDADYQHSAGDRMDADHDWCGQLDMVLFCRQRIIIYELKGYTVEIRYGTTTNQKWKIKRRASDHPVLVPSLFQQASEQRAFLLQEYLERFRLAPLFNMSTHFVVDARIVFKGESDLSGFFYAIPRTEDHEIFQCEVLDRISDDDDRRFTDDFFSGIEYCTGKRFRPNRPRHEYERLKSIYAKYDIRPRTTKWFRTITENMIADDFPETGSDRFELSYDIALKMARQLPGFGLSRSA
jgi:hypothetical protein